MALCMLLFVMSISSSFLLEGLHLVSAQELHIQVDTDSGIDDKVCLNYSTAVKCKSLEFVAEELPSVADAFASIHIQIISPEINLISSLDFRDIPELSIAGVHSSAIREGTKNPNSSHTVINCNFPDVGLAFFRIQILTIESVEIENCGAQQESTSIHPSRPYVTEKLSVAVYILECFHVALENIEIKNSNGTGLSMYDTGGRVNIKNCTFLCNMVTTQLVGGGGLRIEFSRCSPGVAEKMCFRNHTPQISNSVYTITDCKFINNTASSTPSSAKFVTPFIGDIVPRVGRGGGMYFVMGSKASNNIVEMFDCLFQGNSATRGSGGLLMQFQNSAHNNVVAIRGTRFENNCATEETTTMYGGGLGLEFMLFKHSEIDGVVANNNSFLCRDCNFIKNRADLGGGMSVVVTKMVAESFDLNSIHFDNCTWRKNSAHFGAAAYISPAIWDYTHRGFLPEFQFTNCNFLQNSIQPQALNHSKNNIGSSISGFGAVFISSITVEFYDRIFFSENIGTALYLTKAVVEFASESEVEFIGNTGQKGGAIAMYTSSMLVINNNSTFTFNDNTATLHGAAIYSKLSLPQLLYQNCFLQPTSNRHLSNSSSHFNFFNNTVVSSSGHSIFVSSFQPCRIFCSNMTVESPKEILNCMGEFHLDENTSISTAPIEFHLNEVYPLAVVPGFKQELNLTVKDEADNNLSGLVYEASVDSNSDCNVNPTVAHVSDKSINIRGSVGSHLELVLTTSYLSMRINITLTKCPPGYIQMAAECKCAASRYFGLLTCDPKVVLIDGIWIGLCAPDDNSLCTAYCPYGFCSYSKTESWFSHHVLPSDPAQLDSSICGPDRTGRVCSQCTQNRSVYFHSSRYKCGPQKLCHLGWLFYILSEIIPLTIFFAFILTFNISFTKGSVNGFIFSAQIIDGLATHANGVIHFSPFLQVIHDGLNFFYRFFNLDFFNLERLSFCLWRGATVMDVLVMKYVTVGYAFTLVLLTILISRTRCGRRPNWFSRLYTPRSVLIHGLSAFFVLCYSQIARISFQILNNFCLFSIDHACNARIVHRAGYLDYFSIEHLKYAVVAMVFLIVIVVIPPLLLLGYPLVFKLLGLCRLSESKLASILSRIIPIQLLDSFQSSFKDHLRFFAGFYFLYRALALAFYAYSPTMLQFYTLLEIMLISALITHAVFQPYKSRRHNILDALFIGNLAIINGITVYNFADNTYGFAKLASSSYRRIMAAVQAILLAVPLLYPVFLAVEWTLGRIKKCKKAHKTENSSGDAINLPQLRSGSFSVGYEKW